MNAPSVAVLVPAHNEQETISDTVWAARCQTYPISQVIVVADSCSDDTASLARTAGATVIEVDHAHKGSAQNTGLGYVATDIVIGFDGDTVPDRHCVEHVVRRMERDALAGASTAVLPIQISGFLIRSRRYAYALGTRWWRVMQAAVGRVSVLSGACYAFRTDVLRSIGGFSSVPISEDRDITWRMHGAGHRIGFVPRAVVYTLEPETLMVYRRQVERWAAGFFQVMAGHRGQMRSPRSAFVIGTGLVDLLAAPFAYAAMVLGVAHNPAYLRVLCLWAAAYAVVSTTVVATHVGPRRAIAGFFPHLVMNTFDKYLYLKAFVREWVLDSHYTGWTGRHGRSANVTPITGARIIDVTWWLCIALAVYVLALGLVWPPFWLTVAALLVAPWVAMFSVPAADRYDPIGEATP